MAVIAAALSGRCDSMVSAALEERGIQPIVIEDLVTFGEGARLSPRRSAGPRGRRHGRHARQRPRRTRRPRLRDLRWAPPLGAARLLTHPREAGVPFAKPIMSGPSLLHTYRYAGDSALTRGAAPELRLVTSGGTDPHPFFFRGQLVQPRQTALLLRGLSRIVGTRFYVPPAMLARILREADPVVTSGGGMLRFEGFSGCASAYARVDLSPGAYAGDIVSSGTTNVDFNAPMRAALASVTDTDPIGFAVGVDRVVLERSSGALIERKVPLPLRWLKGFVEVQAYQSRMKQRFELAGADAVRFLRSLPRTASKHAQWIVPSGRGVRVSATEVPGALRAGGMERLRVLEDMAPFAKAFRGFGDEFGQASAWELDFGASRFTLVMSSEVWRGFSGEGQALEVLARAANNERLLARTRAELKWQAEIVPATIAEEVAADAADVRAALTVLGSRGLVGFDLRSGAFFHREMPFDLDAIDALQPRLEAAKKIVASGEVKRGARDDETGGVEILVPGSGVVHRVRLGDEAARCTCPWFAKHKGDRGPCKHVLAAQMVLDEERA